MADNFEIDLETFNSNTCLKCGHDGRWEKLKNGEELCSCGQIRRMKKASDNPNECPKCAKDDQWEYMENGEQVCSCGFRWFKFA